MLDSYQMATVCPTFKRVENWNIHTRIYVLHQGREWHDF